MIICLPMDELLKRTVRSECMVASYFVAWWSLTMSVHAFRSAPESWITMAMDSLGLGVLWIVLFGGAGSALALSSALGLRRVRSVALCACAILFLLISTLLFIRLRFASALSAGLPAMAFGAFYLAWLDRWVWRTDQPPRRRHDDPPPGAR